MSTRVVLAGAQACVVAFSTSDRDSFDAVRVWKKKVRTRLGPRTAVSTTRTESDVALGVLVYVRVRVCVCGGGVCVCALTGVTGPDNDQDQTTTSCPSQCSGLITNADFLCQAVESTRGDRTLRPEYSLGPAAASFHPGTYTPISTCDAYSCSRVIYNSSLFLSATFFSELDVLTR